MDRTELLAVAREWLAEDPDPVTREDLQQLLADENLDELRERFGARLAFGTAGLRGLLGAGPGRMNRALVRRVTAGLAAYLADTVPGAREAGVVVGHDARRMSPEFAADTVAVLAGAGFKVHRFPGNVTTPLSAYAVTALGACAGVVVTASHNPPEYNGYKVYWGNGAQIIPPHDTGIAAAIDRVGPLEDIAVPEGDALEATGLVHPVPGTVTADYRAKVIALARHPEAPRDFPIVYTPMHGVGRDDVVAVFDTAGFSGLRVVPAQGEPDGAFPTVRFPNPEEPGALDLALELAEQTEADLVLANDPDADRLAVAVRTEDGFRTLSGNDIGALLGHYLLEGPEDPKRLVCTTIVSSRILGRLAAARGARYAETLTGFKWIANKALEEEAANGARFVFGFEEALGYTVSDLVRDKDGVGAALVFADLVAHLRSLDETVLDLLDRIHAEFGVHAGSQRSLTRPGSAGAAEITAMMDSLRADSPKEIAGAEVVREADVKTGTERDRATGETRTLDLPSSDVLRWELADGTRVLVRPSGTEPKIKFYVETVTPVGEKQSVAEARTAGEARTHEVLDAVVAEAEGRV